MGPDLGEHLSTRRTKTAGDPFKTQRRGLEAQVLHTKNKALSCFDPNIFPGTPSLAAPFKISTTLHVSQHNVFYLFLLPLACLPSSTTVEIVCAVPQHLRLGLSSRSKIICQTNSAR